MYENPWYFNNKPFETDDIEKFQRKTKEIELELKVIGKNIMVLATHY